MNEDFATHDENWLQADDNSLGKQEKRVKLALEMSEHSDRQDVTNATVGARRKMSTKMCLKMLVEQADDGNEGHMAIQAIVTAGVAAGIAAACAPDGAIRNAIDAAITTACAANGAVTNAIVTACAPGGAISNVLKLNSRVTAVLAMNSLAVAPADIIIAPPRDAIDDTPENFPQTVHELRTLSLATVNQLLQFYDLTADGTLQSKRARLATFCVVRGGA